MTIIIIIIILIIITLLVRILLKIFVREDPSPASPHSLKHSHNCSNATLRSHLITIHPHNDGKDIYQQRVHQDHHHGSDCVDNDDDDDVKMIIFVL